MDDVIETVDPMYGCFEQVLDAICGGRSKLQDLDSFLLRLTATRPATKPGQAGSQDASAG